MIRSENPLDQIDLALNVLSTVTQALESTSEHDHLAVTVQMAAWSIKEGVERIKTEAPEATETTV
jgi:hypothetical protein